MALLLLLLLPITPLLHATTLAPACHYSHTCMPLLSLLHATTLAPAFHYSRSCMPLLSLLHATTLAPACHYSHSCMHATAGAGKRVPNPNPKSLSPRQHDACSAPSLRYTEVHHPEPLRLDTRKYSTPNPLRLDFLVGCAAVARNLTPDP